MKNQNRRAHISDVLQWRAIPEEVESFKKVAAEICAVAVCAVARAFVADEVGETAQGDCGFEHVGVAYYPVRHEAAVRAARHTQTITINPGVFCERGFDAVHDVSVIVVSPLIFYATLESLTVACGAARVRV